MCFTALAIMKKLQTSYDMQPKECIIGNVEEISKEYNIEYFVRPSSGNKMHVVQPPRKMKCKKCSFNHECILFPLEKNMYTYYCPYFQNGNWIFSENPPNL